MLSIILLFLAWLVIGFIVKGAASSPVFRMICRDLLSMLLWPIWLLSFLAIEEWLAMRAETLNVLPTVVRDKVREGKLLP